MDSDRHRHGEVLDRQRAAEADLRRLFPAAETYFETRRSRFEFFRSSQFTLWTSKHSHGSRPGLFVDWHGANELLVHDTQFQFSWDKFSNATAADSERRQFNRAGCEQC